MGQQGKLNQYTCQKCGKRIVTIDRDDGVTPFMLECRATEGCSGPMYSSFYTVQGSPVPGFEWRNPTEEEIVAESAPYGDDMLQEMRQYYGNGALALFPITKEDL